jgi:hypothetical protein
VSATSPRKKHMDVSNTVDVTDPNAVTLAVRNILDERYTGYDFSPVNTLVNDFSRLYGGKYPGYKACDINYHNAQHVLDVTLAMARLVDGYEQVSDEEDQLGPQLALTGIAGALFHDAGYIQRTGDNRHSNGAGYTRTHVTRSAKFLSDYLPSVGLESIRATCQRIVHFTGYEVNPDVIKVKSARERVLGALLGTADLIAQMADVDYVKKCHDDLFSEFEAGGMTGESGVTSSAGVVFRSPQHLLESTPNFIRMAIDVRLDGYFKGVYRHAADFFNGPNLYMESIERNCRELERQLAAGN